MGLKEDLIAEVNQTFKNQWDVQKTTNVPDPEDLQLNSNHAKDLESATVLYADIDGSTNMVDKCKWSFSAEVYKAYLRCAAQIIRNEEGTITAYDGDRVMAVFTGNSKNTNAVRASLKINYSVEEIIKPAIRSQYNTDFLFKHVVGIDTSELRTARIGVHGENDLVWIGRAANYAAKLCTLSDKPIWITKAIHNTMHESVKLSKNKENMWTSYKWNAMNGVEIFATTYYWIF